ncbi:MAG: hypothetical protein HY531_00825 [Chloroflexi bacterium]|nr:hypothetical protein [Chloroflexota bacterium]
MPKKSRRVASRQAGLSGRAKRERPHGPAGIPKTPPRREPGSGDGRVQTTTSAQAPLPSRAVLETGVAPQRQRGRGPQQRKPLETYFVSEVRRIGLTSAVILLILAVLVFILR